VAFFLRIYATNEKAIDHDEYDVYRRVLDDELLWQIPFGSARLNHHPLALFLAKSSMELLGNSLFSLRWPSICMSVISIIFIYKIAVWLFNRRVGIAAALLLTFNPFALYYTHNSRGYLAMMFYVLLAHYLALHAIRSNQKRYWLATGVVMTLAVYNHLYALLGWLGLFWTIFVQSFYKKRLSLQLWGKMILTMLLSLTATLVLFLPILQRALTEDDIAVEMQEPSVAPSPFWTLSWFSGVDLDGLNANPIIFYVLITLVAITTLLILYNQPPNYRAYHLLGWFFLPLIIYHFGNWFIFPSILGRPRYFSFVLPFYLIILAVSPFELARFTEKFLPTQLNMAIIYYVVLLAVVLAFWIPPWREMYTRDATGNWPAVADYLSHQMQPLDIVICESFEHEWWSDNYLDQNGNCRRNIEYWLDTHHINLIYPVYNLGEISSYDKIKDFDPSTLARVRRIWVIVWGVPPDIKLDNQAYPEWNRFGRTVVLPPSLSSNAVEALMIHIEQLNSFSNDPTTQLIHHSRLALLAGIQGQTERVAREREYIEKLRKQLQIIPSELEQHLETEKRVLDFQLSLR
jgi:hypothetical protein